MARSRGTRLADFQAARPVVGQARHPDRRREFMSTDIDTHLGKRLRRRRRLLGMTQQQLASSCGVRFQQIQKYECGANRISAARLWSLSEALEVPIGYFYDGLSDAERAAANDTGEDVKVSSKETMDLIRAYYQLGERPRRRLLELAKSFNDETSAA
jgi:transcriptional regulator with XRE-family HTH domain